MRKSALSEYLEDPGDRDGPTGLIFGNLTEDRVQLLGVGDVILAGEVVVERAEADIGLLSRIRLSKEGNSEISIVPNDHLIPTSLLMCRNM